jgi:LPS O-antigen subunit length determinant protein (WzzB/FepE family)
VEITSVSEVIDYDFFLKLTAIIGGAIGILKYIDHHYKEKANRDTTQKINTKGVEYLQSQIKNLLQELDQFKKDYDKKLNEYYDDHDDTLREVKSDIIKLLAELSHLQGEFKTYKEMDKHGD